MKISCSTRVVQLKKILAEVNLPIQLFWRTFTLVEVAFWRKNFILLLLKLNFNFHLLHLLYLLHLEQGLDLVSAPTSPSQSHTKATPLVGCLTTSHSDFLTRNKGELKILLQLKVTSAKFHFGMNFFNSPKQKGKLNSCTKMWLKLDP